MEAHRHFIDGTWVRTPERLPVINPFKATGSIARGQEAEIDAGVRAAQQALMALVSSRPWLAVASSFDYRDLLRRDAEQLTKLESEDVGKPLSLALHDVLLCTR
jgi:aldehyde dehydrogenase (NAD+)